MRQSARLLAIEEILNELALAPCECDEWSVFGNAFRASATATFARRKPITVFAWVDDEPESVEALRNEVVEEAKRSARRWCPSRLAQAVSRLVAAEKREGA